MTTFQRSARLLSLTTVLLAATMGLLASPAIARKAYTLNYGTGTVVAIDTAINQVVGTPIPIGPTPYSHAITPDGKFMYVLSQNEKDVRVVNLQTDEVGPTIALPGQPTEVAISPDGKTAYVGDESDKQIVAISTATNQIVGAPIPIGTGLWGVAFAPDGKTAYVAGVASNSVYVIDTQTAQVVGAPIMVGEEPINITFTPDGKFAYVSDEGSNSVSVIDTQTRQTIANIPVGVEPWGVAITPDGAKAYVANLNDGTVSVINTLTRAVVGPPITVGKAPYEIALTPDGKTAYVADYLGEGVSVINTQTDQVSGTIADPGGPWQIVMAPDQSPTAALKVGAAKAGKQTGFNGDASTDADGLVSIFGWSFGDGKTALTTTPKTSHKYKQAGKYSPSLTVTDNEGCSAALVFTGRTAYCSGSTLSTATTKITVIAPNDFTFGRLTKNRRNGTAKLKVKVPAAGVLSVSGAQVQSAKRKAAKPRALTLTIRPKAKLEKTLASTGRAQVRIKIKFIPKGGPARTKSKTLTLIQG